MCPYEKIDDEELDRRMDEKPEPHQHDGFADNPDICHATLGVMRLKDIDIKDVPKHLQADHQELLQAAVTFGEMLAMASKQDTPEEEEIRFRETGQYRNHWEEARLLGQYCNLLIKRLDKHFFGKGGIEGL